MKRNQYVAVLVLGLLLTVVWNTVAQDAPEPTTEPKAAAVEKTKTAAKLTLGGLWKQGGLIMYPLGLLSVAAVGLTIYGFTATQSRKMLGTDHVPVLQQELMSLHVEEAKEICNGAPGLLTNTLSAGLDRLSDGVLDVPSMEKAMEEASVHEVTAGLKPISYLSIIAQVAPMLGLLGTVSGMIKAFQKIGTGGMGNPELLAADIGEAMVTTAGGLLVGIPAMFFYFYLKSRYLSNVSEMSRVLGNLCHQLVSAARTGDVDE